MTRLKICGIRTVSDLEVCRRADYLGFVVLSDSPNCLDLETAAGLMSSCDRPTVAVTTETDAEVLRSIVHDLRPDILQLHSPMYPEVLEATGDLGVPVWGMMTVHGGTAVRSLEGIKALVLDSPGPRAGGSGTTHNWSVSRDIRERVDPFPVVLAGGIGPHNAADAIRKVEPFAVDVSSGVRGIGGKDPVKVTELIEIVKGD